jgi:hypothetical protein
MPALGPLAEIGGRPPLVRFSLSTADIRQAHCPKYKFKNGHLGWCRLIPHGTEKFGENRQRGRCRTTLFSVV